MAGVWGNHEGSLLLWVLILAVFGAAVAAFGRHLPDRLKARALAVQGMIGAGFLAFILFTSNPFLRLDPVPVQGEGLNPLLQDPGPRLPSADALLGLCRLLHGLFFRRCSFARRPGRCRVGQVGAALDLGCMVRS